ncbi:MAG: hypothetical protein U1E52_19395 [Geminicoccaceae bacterium]
MVGLIGGDRHAELGQHRPVEPLGRRQVGNAQVDVVDQPTAVVLHGGIPARLAPWLPG